MPDESEDAPRPRKDRLIQTRVPRDLESTLKDEARRRRLSVSHLIRSVLEDAFQLMDDVVTDVDEIVTDSARLARHVTRNARRLASPGRDAAAAAAADAPTETSDDFADVYAWNELVLNRATTCSSCKAPIPRGERGFSGLSDDRDAPRAWLCTTCAEALSAADS